MSDLSNDTKKTYLKILWDYPFKFYLPIQHTKKNLKLTQPSFLKFLIHMLKDLNMSFNLPEIIDNIAYTYAAVSLTLHARWMWY
jgi:hypothetical protein